MHVTNKAAKLMREAEREGVAVPAFNVHNYEFIQGAVMGTIKVQGRCLLEVGPKSLRYIDLPVWYRLARAVAEAVDMEIPLHLDHCPDVALCLQAVTLGFDSVMFDGSHLPHDENVRLTRRVVDLAHAHNVLVEGEIGPITHDPECRVSADAIRDFAQRTQVDLLASGFGTEHGAVTRTLDLARIGELATLGIPLVLHGSSGVPHHLLRQAVKLGIRKVNVGTALNRAFMRAFAGCQAEDDPRAMLQQARQSITHECLSFASVLMEGVDRT